MVFSGGKSMRQCVWKVWVVIGLSQRLSLLAGPSHSFPGGGWSAGACPTRLPTRWDQLGPAGRPPPCWRINMIKAKNLHCFMVEAIGELTFIGDRLLAKRSSLFVRPLHAWAQVSVRALSWNATPVSTNCLHFQEISRKLRPRENSDRPFTLINLC